MAVYSDKVKDSFETKLKIFLFIKAFERNVLNYIKNDIDLIRKEFNEFKLTEEIAQVYSAQYYQFDDDRDIKLKDRQLKSKDLVHNLMDNQKYIISSANLKIYLNDIYDKLKHDYEYNSNVIQQDEFSKLLQNEICAYCGISKKQIKILGDNAQLNNKRSETRGYTLEIDRKKPNLEYTKENCCMSCYWCNNAKTDEFSVSEFKEIAKGINKVWNKRLKKENLDEEVIFPKKIYNIKNNIIKGIK